MDGTKIASKIARFRSGLLSAAEVAQGLLFQVLSEPELDESFLDSVDSLPDDVRAELFGLLHEIRDAGYHWTPFLITSATERIEPADYPQKLRRVCLYLKRFNLDEVGSAKGDHA
jgi:hypothetical protein